MRLISFYAMVLLLMLSVSSTALACDCITLKPEESFKQADVVFEGQLIRSTNNPNASPLGKNISYTFEVRNMLKGPAAKELTLVGGQSNCDFFFYPYTVYRVNARRIDGELFTGSCSGNEVLSKKTYFTHMGVQTTFPWRFWFPRVFFIASIGLLVLLIVWFLVRGFRLQRS